MTPFSNLTDSMANPVSDVSATALEQGSARSSIDTKIDSAMDTEDDATLTSHEQSHISETNDFLDMVSLLLEFTL